MLHDNLPTEPYFEPGQLSPHLAPPLARTPNHALVSSFSPFSRLPTRIMFAFLSSRKSCPSVPPNFHRPNNARRIVQPHYTITSWFLLLPPSRCDILPCTSILTTVVTGLPSAGQNSRTYYVQSQYIRSLTMFINCMICFGEMAPSSGPNIHHTFEKEIYCVCRKRVINL